MTAKRTGLVVVLLACLTIAIGGDRLRATAIIGLVLIVVAALVSVTILIGVRMEFHADGDKANRDGTTISEYQGTFARLSRSIPAFWRRPEGTLRAASRALESRPLRWPRGKVVEAPFVIVRFSTHDWSRLESLLPGGFIAQDLLENYDLAARRQKWLSIEDTLTLYVGHADDLGAGRFSIDTSATGKLLEQLDGHEHKATLASTCRAMVSADGRVVRLSQLAARTTKDAMKDRRSSWGSTSSTDTWTATVPDNGMREGTCPPGQQPLTGARATVGPSWPSIALDGEKTITLPTLALFLASDPRPLYMPPHGGQLGRDGRCEIVILDKRVSRTHAQLHRDGDTWLVENLSRFGTLLNGSPVDRLAPVQDGDEPAMGDTTIKVAISRVG